VHEGVAQLRVAVRFRLANLNFTLETFILIVWKKQISASRSGGHYVVRLCISNKIK
jgi:hypothetical protein